LEVTAKGGGVSALNIALDIGATGAPTIVIVNDQVAITKTVPFEVVSAFPVFVGSTFIANGGQIFISTDTGTATIAARGISIYRTNSGAS